jgi:hypothetical protein
MGEITDPLSSAAWAALTNAWGLRGLLLLLMGIIPVELAKLWHRRTESPRAWAVTRVLSGGIVLACISMLPLLYDTYLVESNESRVMVKKACIAEVSPDARDVLIQCGPLGAYTLPLTAVSQVGPGNLVLLRNSGTPIYFGKAF